MQELLQLGVATMEGLQLLGTVRLPSARKDDNPQLRSIVTLRIGEAEHFVVIARARKSRLISEGGWAPL